MIYKICNRIVSKKKPKVTEAEKIILQRRFLDVKESSDKVQMVCEEPGITEAKYLNLGYTPDSEEEDPVESVRFHESEVNREYQFLLQYQERDVLRIKVHTLSTFLNKVSEELLTRDFIRRKNNRFDKSIRR